VAPIQAPMRLLASRLTTEVVPGERDGDQHQQPHA